MLKFYIEWWILKTVSFSKIYLKKLLWSIKNLKTIKRNKTLYNLKFVIKMLLVGLFHIICLGL